MAVKKKFPYRSAVVACNGGCRAAEGETGCKDGCIGCEACVNKCKFGAISINEYGVAEVDEENPDVYDALSRKYLSIGCSCMSPNKARMELLEKLIKDFKVDAVVDLVLQACHTYNVETAMVKKLVKDKMGIPYTVVETDYSQADVGQIQTRMAAFIEML